GGIARRSASRLIERYESSAAPEPERTRSRRTGPFSLFPLYNGGRMDTLVTSVVEAALAEVETPLLVIPQFEDDTLPAGAAAEIDAQLGGELGRILGRGDFRGKADEALVVYPRPGEVGA